MPSLRGRKAMAWSLLLVQVHMLFGSIEAAW